MSLPPPAAAPRACLVVEDLPASRDMLCRVAETAFPGIALTATASLREAEAALGAPRGEDSGFDLALIDLGLPDGSGVSLVRRISEAHPATLPVVATIYDGDAHLFEAIA